MSSDVMRVRLHLRGVRVLEVVADSPGRLEVAVEATWSTSRCPHCGFKCRGVHDRRRQAGLGPAGVGARDGVVVAAPAVALRELLCAPFGGASGV